jgi:hypothetical protein
MPPKKQERKTNNSGSPSGRGGQRNQNQGRGTSQRTQSNPEKKKGQKTPQTNKHPEGGLPTTISPDEKPNTPPPTAQVSFAPTDQTTETGPSTLTRSTPMELDDNVKFPSKPDLSVPTGKVPTAQYYQSISLVGQLKQPPFKMANFQDPTTDLDLESIQNYRLQHQSMQAYNREGQLRMPHHKAENIFKQARGGTLMKPMSSIPLLTRICHLRIEMARSKRL